MLGQVSKQYISDIIEPCINHCQLDLLIGVMVASALLSFTKETYQLTRKEMD